MNKIFAWFICGVLVVILANCTSNPTITGIDSTESAYRALQQQILPEIEVEENFIAEEIALRYATNDISEPVPDLNKFPLYAAQPDDNPNTVYLEIFSSAEKANAEKLDERWLVDVAEAFNAQKFTTAGKVIQVGIRNIPSGIGEQMISAGVAQPAGYTPSHALWLEMLKSEGIRPIPITDALLVSNAGFAIADSLKQELAPNGEVTFEQLLDAILAGKVTIGYTNPYASSTGMNLLYTLFWQAADHQDGKPLTIADLQSPQVQSVFEAFQKQVLVTALITPDLKEIFLRDPERLPAFAIDYLSYSTLKQLPEFAQTSYIPFGVPHNSPLVGFDWNSPAQQAALNKFAQFANSASMQKLAPARGTEVTGDRTRQIPALPQGEVLTAAQEFWKQYKDTGRTVYLEAVIDTSGSMEGEPLQAVQEGLRIASQEINTGNYVGLITFSDRPQINLPLAPFDQLQHQRLLAAVDSLRADGSTAMYDAMMVGLAQLMEQQKAHRDGRFYLLVLTDGRSNRGFGFQQIEEVLAHSGIRFYPIAYGDVNDAELAQIAALRESTVKTGTPENVQSLLKGLFQINL